MVPGPERRAVIVILISGVLALAGFLALGREDTAFHSPRPRRHRHRA